MEFTENHSYKISGNTIEIYLNGILIDNTELLEGHEIEIENNELTQIKK